jgi:hypothetical protein
VGLDVRINDGRKRGEIGRSKGSPRPDDQDAFIAPKFMLEHTGTYQWSSCQRRYNTAPEVRNASPQP